MYFKELSLLILLALISSCHGQPKTHFLQQGDSISKLGAEKFNIFCYAGRPKYLIYLWQSVYIRLAHPSDDYIYYDGSTPAMVQKQYEEHKSSWNLNLFSWKQKHFKLNPFNQSCVGIETRENYSISLQVIRIDYWKVLLVLTGIFLYISANKLSQNSLFYYFCGITLGITMSFVILIYFISRFFPKKPLMYGVAACGWTVGIYLLQLLWDNIRVILLNYQIYVIGYITISAFISFIVCYRWGPVEDERSRNLIRWALQLLGLSLIFFSTDFQEAAMGQIILLLLFYNIPPSWLAKSKKYWKKKFPPKIKLLSNDEYYEQGVRETIKALDELRQFCSSPDCNQWKMALKLKDVKRFASFVEGNSHLSDEEVLEYETSMHVTNLTDDEEITDDEN